MHKFLTLINFLAFIFKIPPPSLIYQHVVKKEKGQIDNNTDRTQDVIFSRFQCFSFTLTLRHAHALSLSCNSTLPARDSFGLLPQGYCEQKPTNLEKTTSSVLSVLLLIYGKKARSIKECQLTGQLNITPWIKQTSKCSLTVIYSTLIQDK